MDRFGKLAREVRDAKGLTIEQMAKRLDVSESFMRHIEYNPKTILSDRVLERLLKLTSAAKAKMLKRAVVGRNRVGKAHYSELRKRLAKRAA